MILLVNLCMDIAIASRSYSPASSIFLCPLLFLCFFFLLLRTSIICSSIHPSIINTTAKIIIKIIATPTSISIPIQVVISVEKKQTRRGLSQQKMDMPCGVNYDMISPKHHQSFETVIRWFCLTKKHLFKILQVIKKGRDILLMEEILHHLGCLKP